MKRDSLNIRLIVNYLTNAGTIWTYDLKPNYKLTQNEKVIYYLLR